jgi:hypothetical protein
MYRRCTKHYISFPITQNMTHDSDDTARVKPLHVRPVTLPADPKGKWLQGRQMAVIGTHALFDSINLFS